MAKRHLLPSISFSGAGFLGAYHSGVASCLQEHGLLPDYSRDDAIEESPSNQVLLGSSAGSLISSAILCGVPADSQLRMANKISALARARPLDSMTPGFSLIDELEPLLRSSLKDHSALGRWGDESDYLRKRVSRKLQVNLSAAINFPLTMKDNRIVDSFECIDELIAACILSSYVPFATGPLNPSPGDAVSDAMRSLNINSIRPYYSNSPNDPPNTRYIDGGLTAMFPLLNENTLIVSPLPVRARKKTNRVICPKFSPAVTSMPIFNGGTELAIKREVPQLLKAMLMSGGERSLENFFVRGHDDAGRFVKEELVM